MKISCYHLRGIATESPQPDGGSARTCRDPDASGQPGGHALNI